MSKVDEPFENSLNKSIDNVTLEIKRKKNNLSDKISIKIDKKEFKGLTRFLPLLRKDIEKILHNHNEPGASHLLETAFISYNRQYYESFESSVRLTIDTCLLYSEPRDINFNLMSQDFSVVELKCDKTMVGDMPKILKNFPIRASRFSKYLNAMSKLKNVSY